VRAALIALAALTAGAVAAQEVRFAEADPEAEEVIAVAFEETLIDAEEMGGMVGVFAGRADLDGDGTDELLGMVQSGAICGAAVGCPVGVFKAGADGTWTQVATLGADTVTLEKGRTRGWRDLSLGMQTGEVRVRWTGGGYAPR
jgi:hypothetical protein